jgi:4-aminobutyrate aminotransferase-like enzyme/Ser/Thr protein kinase RdoA (MazF antagonist)
MALESPKVPAVPRDVLARGLHDLFGVTGSLHELPGERDFNLRVERDGSPVAVLKVIAPDEPGPVLDMHTAMLEHLAHAAPDVALPRVIRARNGEAVQHISHGDRSYRIRLSTFVNGARMADVPRTPEQLDALGATLGRLTAGLRGFGHSGAHRNLAWDLERAGAAEAHLPHVEVDCRAVVARALLDFRTNVAPVLPSLRHTVVHGDPNDWNVLVDSDHPDRIAGLIDVGDAVYSVTIADLAIACAYAVMGSAAPILDAARIVRAFHAVYSVEAIEAELLHDLIRTRLAVSLCMSAARRAWTSEPDPYWFVSEKPAWTLLRQLDAVPRAHAVGLFRRACGLEGSPHSAKFSDWLTRSARGPVFERPLERHRCRRLHWESASDPVVEASMRMDRAAAEEAYAAQTSERKFDLGVGIWGERRAIYAARAFESKVSAGRRRTMHLGLDLFAPAGTPVRAPLDGTVVSTAVCDAPQDYGGVVLLEHEPEPGLRFCTLWGHLQHNSAPPAEVGRTVRAGDIIGYLGDWSQNGGWIPHLHLQLVLTPERDVGAIVGVGEPELADLWQDLYPDPAVFAGLSPEVSCYLEKDEALALARRKRHFAPSLRLSYDTPLHVLRGRDVWLYDASGRAYLDCYNNVAHVGHCHPRVVEALASQAAKLSSNTRYLSALPGEYAERLTAGLPPALSVVFLTNSGSEANELALRIARTVTGRRTTAVLDWGYHGWTPTLIDVSAYKYKRPGGSGRADYVVELPCPDAYREGLPADTAGSTFATRAISVLDAAPNVACFLAETVPSCAGQIVVPKGFFRGIFEYIRSRGGLCILDEVQVGMGRVGTGMWAFSEHGIEPDIVTLGKPIGNGYPLGAVITTRDIAERFNTGIEYFNTFGGNHVACAAGLAVLDTLQCEELLSNATRRGRELAGRLAAMADPGIGDVRGRGLFIGLELVRDRATREPDTARARKVVNQAKEQGVLLGTDGPADNVVKIRPPMTFGSEHVDLLVGCLERVLNQHQITG